MPPYDFDTHNDGFWGDTTSTLDWCENNYEVNKYNHVAFSCYNLINILLSFIGDMVYCRIL